MPSEALSGDREEMGVAGDVGAAARCLTLKAKPGWSQFPGIEDTGLSDAGRGEGERSPAATPGRCVSGVPAVTVLSVLIQGQALRPPCSPPLPPRNTHPEM